MTEIQKLKLRLYIAKCQVAREALRAKKTLVGKIQTKAVYRKIFVRNRT